MNLTEIWTQIEEELAWRQDELRFLNNQIELLGRDEEKKKLRRAALLMIYAHFEGFTKFAFDLYITVINNEELECRDVTATILACSFNDLFKALRNPDSKSHIFRNSLPDDTQLHRFARSVHFLEDLDEKLSLKVNIPDGIIDIESNLKPQVISKLLFSIGLDHKLFEDKYPTINRLLNKRNKIAHGETRAGIEEDEFNLLYTLSMDIINEVKSRIMHCLTTKQYLKSA